MKNFVENFGIIYSISQLFELHFSKNKKIDIFFERNNELFDNIDHKISQKSENNDIVYKVLFNFFYSMKN